MKKILIVEDDLLILESTEEFLKEEGFDVYTAHDGVQGIQLAIEIIPDMIICDITIPKKNGFEVCKVLQSIPSLGTIPFIFLTGKTRQEDIRQGMQLGADDYIIKPFNFSDLLQSIKSRFKKQQQFSKQSDESFFALIDNPLMGVYVYRNNRFIYSNPVFSKITGYSKYKLYLMSFDDLAPAEENYESLGKITRCIKGYQSSVCTELKILKKGKTPVSVKIFGAIIKLKGKECLMGNILQVESVKKIELHPCKDFDVSKLTEKELKVLHLTCRGLSSTEISEKLLISRRTIESQRARLLEKTGTRNIAELVMCAAKNGLVRL
jgi:PAS domain S-box-containing protein